LKPGVGIVHDKGRSEFLRAKDGHDEIDEEGEGDQADEDDFHDRRKVGGSGGRCGSAYFFAEPDVGRAEDEEAHGKGDKDEIVHDG
jgi:hypothetical protein